MTPSQQRPILVWDGECGFCRSSVERIRAQLGEAIADAPYQEVARRFPGIQPEAFARAVHLILPDGQVSVGAEAIFRALAWGGRGFGLWCYRRLPGFSGLSEAGYQWIATHRALVTRISRGFFGGDLRPHRHRATRWLYLRLLALAALSAFASIAVQLDGLIGAGGILPAAETLHRIGSSLGGGESSPIAQYLEWPTLLWFTGASDGWLRALSGAGLLAALLLFFDVAPGLMVLTLWILYLSLVSVGGIFFRYQWDALLLEALFVSLFFAPWRLRPRLRTDPEPSAAGLWLVRLLLFKLMLMSGLVKLLSNDGTWVELTALQFHFFTQPLPIWTSYYVQQLPAWALAGATLCTLLIEVILPFLIFGPRRLRLITCGGTLLLMAMIGLTGSYGFFNPLAVALAVSLLDDAVIERWTPGRVRRWLGDAGGPAPQVHRRLRHAVGIAALGVILLSGLRARERLDRDYDPPALAKRVLAAVQPYSSINTYGLFASMTTERPEIIVEGSRDGMSWEPYRFRYKIGDPGQAPRAAGVHMPRLDWQMWFAALRGCRRAPWFHAFLARLLSAEPGVRALLEEDPFGADPPRYLRSTLYHYRFQSLEEGRRSGTWWSRRRSGAFCPVVELREGRLQAVPAARSRHFPLPPA